MRYHRWERGSGWEALWRFWQLAEKQVIRLLVLASIVVIVGQLSSARDPVQFYLAVAQKVEVPPLELAAGEATASAAGPTGASSQTFMLALKAQPAAPVRVLQQGRQIGTLARGELVLRAQAGRIELDAQGIRDPVKITVSQKDKALQAPHLNQTFVLQGNVLSVSVSP